MARFVDDESKAKRDGKGMDISSWPRFNYVNVPRQTNGIDCGEYPAVTKNTKKNVIVNTAGVSTAGDRPSQAKPSQLVGTRNMGGYSLSSTCFRSVDTQVDAYMQVKLGQVRC